MSRDVTFNEETFPAHKDLGNDLKSLGPPQFDPSESDSDEDLDIPLPVPLPDVPDDEELEEPQAEQPEPVGANPPEPQA